MTTSNTDEESRDPRRLIIFAIVSTIAALILVRFLYEVRSTLVLAYIAGLLAMGISPLVQIIERQKLVPIGHRLPRWLAILIIYATIVGAIALLLMIVIPPLIQQGEELWRTLPEKFARAQEFLVRLGVLRRPITLGEVVQQAPAGGSANAVGTIFNTVKNVAGGVFGVITLLLLTFYMLVDSRDIFRFFVRLFPRRQRARVAAVSSAVTLKVSAWLGGQLLLSLIIGLTSAVGLWVMGVPYFYVLALISAVGEMIPMVGPILSAIPAILVAATVSPGLAIGVAIFFIIQQQVENTILVPKIMGRQVGLSAVTVIIALGMGSAVLGVVGAILSLPTAAIVQVLFEELVARDD
ncbi:MAG TPA: AI-2E family transporter [Vicinamibacterales bacterium]|nr:AI-2E family transporter [Vicinamibacterales bacterium]